MYIELKYDAGKSGVESVEATTLEDAGLMLLLFELRFELRENERKKDIPLSELFVPFSWLSFEDNGGNILEAIHLRIEDIFLLLRTDTKAKNE